MDDRRPPRRGEGDSALPGNRYSPRSGYRPRSESSSGEPSSRGPRDWGDQGWREEDRRTPPTRPRSSSGRRPPPRGAWDDDMAPPRRAGQARARFSGESDPRSARSRDDAWTPAATRNGRGAPPKKKSSRAWLFVMLGLLLVAVPTAVVISQWSRIQALTGLGGGDPLFPWAHQTQQTAVNPDYDAFAAQQAAIDPAFKEYYGKHAGATLLGAPLTGALPTSAGLAQFFTDGALLLPNAQGSSAGSSSGDTAIQLAGATKGASDVMRLPLPAALLKLGSQAPVGGLTYGDLRAAAQPEKLVSGAPATPASGATSNDPVLFGVKSGSGHMIPSAIWAYVNGATTSPGGMLANFGRPLSEALETTATVDGATHHIVVQPFWYGVVIVDNDAKDAQGQPKITLATAGTDYLRTLGPPTVRLAAKTSAWGNATAALLDAPDTGKPVATIGPNFPLTLSGETKWSKATLWYNASFSAAKRSGSGWAPASALTLTTPTDKAARAEAGLDMLSPDLAAYVASQQKNMGVSIFDITRNIYYGANDTHTFTLASAAKVGIMASYMDWVEGQNRPLNSSEINDLTLMIQLSDNQAAQDLFKALGWGDGQKRFLHKIGIDDYVACGDGWGCAELSPASMTKLVTMLYQGKILTKEHQQLALQLMNSVDPGMRWGVGDTAPKGSTVYMKDGWLNVTSWTDWALNTTGVVVAGNETYAITVLSQHSTSEDWSKVNKVCGDVAKLLTA